MKFGTSISLKSSQSMSLQLKWCEYNICLKKVKKTFKTSLKNAVVPYFFVSFGTVSLNIENFDLVIRNQVTKIIKNIFTLLCKPKQFHYFQKGLRKAFSSMPHRRATKLFVHFQLKKTLPTLLMRHLLNLIIGFMAKKDQECY